MATHRFVACTRQACEPDRIRDPQGWCQHDHQAWDLAGAPTYDEWVAATVASAVGSALTEDDR